jgi:hypothetical protein
MNWNPLTWFSQARDDRRRAFDAGLMVSREEYVAGLLDDAVKARRHGLDVTLSAIDAVAKLDNSDPAKAAAIEAFKSGIVEQGKTLRSLMEHPMSAGQERQEALAHPFDDAESFATSTNGLPRPTPKALSNETGDQSSKTPTDRQALPNGKSPEGPKTPPPPTAPDDMPPPRKGPGRPRKHPRPEANGDGRMNESSPQDQSGPES